MSLDEGHVKRVGRLLARCSANGCTVSFLIERSLNIDEHLLFTDDRTICLKR